MPWAHDAQVCTARPDISFSPMYLSPWEVYPGSWFDICRCKPLTFINSTSIAYLHPPFYISATATAPSSFSGGSVESSTRFPALHMMSASGSKSCWVCSQMGPRVLTFLVLRYWLHCATCRRPKLPYRSFCFLPCPLVVHSKSSNQWPWHTTSVLKTTQCLLRRKVHLRTRTSLVRLTSAVPWHSLLLLSLHSVQTSCATHSLAVKHDRNVLPDRLHIPNPSRTHIPQIR